MSKPTLSELEKAAEIEIKNTAVEFLSLDNRLKVAKTKMVKEYEEVLGPGIEVVGRGFSYSCVLEYETAENEKILGHIFDKLPFIKGDELPELDVLDALGEFLNILCGKINAHLENYDPDLHIEVPYFFYGLEPKAQRTNEVVSFRVVGETISFNLYFFWS